LPERLYDDPEDLTGWARAALAAAERAALKKRRKGRKAMVKKKVAKTKKPSS
jgi:DNA transformation protein